MGRRPTRDSRGRYSTSTDTPDTDRTEQVYRNTLFGRTITADRTYTDRGLDTLAVHIEDDDQDATVELTLDELAVLSRGAGNRSRQPPRRDLASTIEGHYEIIDHGNFVRSRPRPPDSESPEASPSPPARGSSPSTTKATVGASPTAQRGTRRWLTYLSGWGWCGTLTSQTTSCFSLCTRGVSQSRGKSQRPADHGQRPTPGGMIGGAVA